MIKNAVKMLEEIVKYQWQAISLTKTSHSQVETKI